MYNLDKVILFVGNEQCKCDVCQYLDICDGVVEKKMIVINVQCHERKYMK